MCLLMRRTNLKELLLDLVGKFIKYLQSFMLFLNSVDLGLLLYLCLLCVGF